MSQLRIGDCGLRNENRTSEIRDPKSQMRTRAGRMRQAAERLREFSNREIADAIGVQTWEEREAVRHAVRDFLRRGEMERIGRSRYRYIKTEKTPTQRQRLWDVARRMYGFTLDDLDQITGISREAIKDFTSWLVNAGYARRIERGRFKVVKKLGPVVAPDRRQRTEDRGQPPARRGLRPGGRAEGIRK